jgi:hypothetical protein
MYSLGKFSYLILLNILMISACKKSNDLVIYQEKRIDLKEVDKPITLNCSNIDLKLNSDSIYGFIMITKSGRDELFNESYASLYFSADGNPIKNYYEGEFKGSPITAKYQTNSANAIYLKFLYENKCYELITRRGFSNAILYSYYQPQGILIFDYKLRYDGAVINTDTIITCSNQVVKLTDTIVKLKTCNSTANYSKPTRFMINFLNQEYFKIGNKYFVIVKQVVHDFTNY